MKKVLLMLSCSMLLFVNINCLKGDDPCTPRSAQNEQAAILAYASANGMTAGTSHPSGLYYQIDNPGTGTVTPTATSTLTADYVGKFISNNVQFDASTPGSPIVFQLGGVIAGWQIGLPLIKKGGVIRMIIPSSLAYGCTGRGSIPPDAVLYFQVTLVDVQ